MKTFESEMEKLKEWILNENDEYIEKIKQRSKNEVVKGHDSELVYERKQVVKEYNRRLMELKIKYSKEITTEQKTENESAPKARTFGQAVSPPI